MKALKNKANQFLYGIDLLNWLTQLPNSKCSFLVSNLTKNSLAMVFKSSWSTTPLWWASKWKVVESFPWHGWSKPYLYSPHKWKKSLLFSLCAGRGQQQQDLGLDHLNYIKVYCKSLLFRHFLAVFSLYRELCDLHKFDCAWIRTS